MKQPRKEFGRAIGETIVGASIASPIGVARFAGRGISRTARALAPRTPKQILATAIGVPTAAGILASSPKVRKIAKSILDPRAGFRRGKGAAELIEKGLPKVPGGGIAEGLKTAGLVGGAVALGGLALAGARRVFRGRDVQITGAPFSPQQLQSQLVPGFTTSPGGIINVPGAVPVEKKPKVKRRARKRKVLKPIVTINNVIQNQILR